MAMSQRNNSRRDVSGKPNYIGFCDKCKRKYMYREMLTYCSECEDYLCTECVYDHPGFTSTNFHTLTQLRTPNEDGTSQQCEPCARGKTFSIASNFCIKCEERLCINCTLAHRNSKATTKHLIYDIENTKRDTGEPMHKQSIKQARIHANDAQIQTHIPPIDRSHSRINSDIRKSGKVCNFCVTKGQNTYAEHFCKQCEEFYCKECRAVHLQLKATRAHNVITAVEVSKICDPCKLCNTKEVKALSFCKECDEFLCATCKEEHTKDKLTKTHTIMSASQGYILQLKEHNLLCESCKLDGTEKTADSYCRDCEMPEPLCEKCAAIHIRQKPTRSHKIDTNRNAFKEIFSGQQKTSVQIKTEIKSSSDELRLDNKVQDGKAAKKKKKDVPGKPEAIKVKADWIQLIWDKPRKLKVADCYQIRYKEDKEPGKWKFHDQEIKEATATLTNLKANAAFVFQVRVVHEDREGPYSPRSEPIPTAISYASKVLKFSKLSRRGEPSPSVYKLPIKENQDGRNLVAKTKKFELGTTEHMNVIKERTIMLVGATGTGKSTFVDAMVNYVLGVQWDDPFRFTMLNLEDEEKDRLHNQALSQTEWVTCYSINPDQGSRLSYRLNIIDTPGFGDTRGIKRDQMTVDQIRQLFSENGSKGVAYIDSVCFLVKAPDARLTSVQTYIFHAIMSLFGRDIINNITTLVTFADGMEPPVLAALKESGMPLGKSFTFNNSGLFTRNVDLDANSLSPMFWHMGCNSFHSFFAHLEKMETKSLQLSKQVLEERKRLEITIQNLQPKVDAGLSKINELKTELMTFEKHKSKIDANKDFEYEVEETHQVKVDLPAGQHVTNCLHCNVTCHQDCAIDLDEDKHLCSAMKSDGYCGQCSHGCHWKQHVNTPYIFEYKLVKLTKTYQDMKNKYHKLTGKTMTHEKLLATMTADLESLEEIIRELMTEVMECNDRLKMIALRPNPLSMIDHLDLMIEAEKMEKKLGFQHRITVLREFRAKALIGTTVKSFSKEAKAAKTSVQNKVSNNSSSIEVKPKEKGIFRRLFDKFF